MGRYVAPSYVIYTTNKSPAHASSDNNNSTAIVFDLIDLDGLDFNATIIWIDGQIVWVNSAELVDNYAVTETAIGITGCRYSITRNGGWPPMKSVVVKVYGADTTHVHTILDQWWFWYGRNALYLRDEFNDLVPLPYLPGNGIVTEPGGLLYIEAPNAVNCDWWQSFRNGKMVYTPVPPSANKIYIVETELYQYYTANSGYSQMWFGVYQDDQNLYAIYTQDGVNYGVVRAIGNSFTGVGSTVATSGTPIKLRLVVNRTFSTIDFQYWNGTTWLNIIAQQTLSISPVYMFWYQKTWTALPRTYSYFSYAQITYEYGETLQDNDRDRMLIDVNQLQDKEQWPLGEGASKHTFPGTNSGVKAPGIGTGQAETNPGPFDVSSLDDRAVVPKHVGPSRFSQPETGGAVHLPGLPYSQYSFLPLGPQDTPSLSDVDVFDEKLSTKYRRQGMRGTPSRSPGGEPLPKTYRYHQMPYHGFPDLQRTFIKGSGADTSFLDDRIRFILGTPPNYRFNTTDSEGHTHFIDRHVKRAVFYDRSYDPWSFPTLNSYTGYAADGKEYLNGVWTGAYASWATEIASNDRSSRLSFPVRTLTVIGLKELVVFDLDNFPNNLDVWIRFKLGNDGSNFYMLGRYDDSIENAVWSNGVLVVGTKHNGTENGGLFAVDFKQKDQKIGILVRQDNHWWLPTGKNITHRNTNIGWTTTGAGSMRIDTSHVYHVAATFNPDSPTQMWIAAGGEDRISVVETLSNQGVQYNHSIGVVGNNYDWNNRAKMPYFDKSGWFWYAQENFLFRNVYDYRGGSLVADLDSSSGIWSNDRTEEPRDGRRHMRVAYANLDSYIYWLTDIGDYIFAATDLGIYKINRYTMEFWLAYTIPEGGGGGRLNVPPAGEVGKGRTNYARCINAFGTPYADMLEWINGQGPFDLSYSTLLRLQNDFVVSQFTNPNLQEDGAYFALSVLVG
jgi:hypothetical protein